MSIAQWGCEKGDNWSQEEQCVPPSTTRGAEESRINGQNPAPEKCQMKCMLHNQHTEQPNDHPQESADYQGTDVFVTKQSQAVNTFVLMVRDF
eukprot:1669525-Ditylum_brightwellii.AAC.1